MSKEYALYKGDKLLGIGTAEELAKKYNIKRDTIFYYASPAYKKRADISKAKNVICLDREDKEWIKLI